MSADIPPVEFPSITEELRQRCLEHARAGADLNAALEQHFQGKDVRYGDGTSPRSGTYKLSGVGWNGSVGFSFRFYLPGADFRSSRSRNVNLDNLTVAG